MSTNLINGHNGTMLVVTGEDTTFLKYIFAVVAENKDRFVGVLTETQREALRIAHGQIIVGFGEAIVYAPERNLMVIDGDALAALRVLEFSVNELGADVQFSEQTKTKLADLIERER